MATLVRKKKAKRAEPAQPLVALGAPHRGNGASTSEDVQVKPIKIHLSTEELLLMDNFNDGASPSAPDFEDDPQLDNWEAIMLGSPMLPVVGMPPMPTMTALDLNPSAPLVATNGDSPPMNGLAYLAPSAPTDEQDAEVTAPPLELAPTTAAPVDVATKYAPLVANASIATVHDLLVAPATKISAPIYPALSMLKPITFTPRVAKVRELPAPPMVPLREVPRVPLRRIDNYEANLRLRDEHVQAYDERLQVLEKAPTPFYRLVEAYLYCEYALRVASSTVAAIEAEIADKARAVWTTGFDSVSASALCGDLQTLTETIEFPTARLDLDMRDALLKQWQALRQLRSAEAAVYTYDRALAFLRVEQHLDGLLLDANDAIDDITDAMDVLWFLEKEVTRVQSPLLGVVPSALRRGQPIVEDDDTKQLQCPACGCLCAFATGPCSRCEALLMVPRSTVALSSPEWKLAVAQVRVSLQHWLGRCATALLATDPAPVLPYLLTHLLHVPLLASDRRWALAFLQLPPLPWSRGILDLFLSLWHLLFHPTQLPPQVVTAHDETEMSPRKQRRSSSVDEWLLIEPEVVDDRPQLLSDADYTALCSQLPLGRAVAHILASDDLAQCFAHLLYLVHECTSVFERFADYDLLVAHVADGLGVILAAAGAHPGSLFDQLFQIALFGVVQSRNVAVYRSLPSWHYAALSPAASWDVLGGLFGQASVGANSYVAFQCWLADSPNLRARLHKHVLKGPGKYLLGAMASLAAVAPWSELVQTIVHELFLSFEATRVLDVHVDALRVVCVAHPMAHSQLLALLPQYECGLALFPKLPLRLWQPTLSDLHILQAWLLQENVMDARSVVARSILESLNWGDAPKTVHVLFLDPFVHRFVSLLLAEATVQLYASARQWPWSMDFRAWAWQLMQQLRFYSTADYLPLLPLIELDTDLSKEALLLRRLTHGLPRSHLVLGQTEAASVAAAMCITYVDGTTVPEAPLRDADDSTGVDAEAVPIARMEPIVLYALCQLTTYLYSSAVDKYAPLLSLLVDHGERGAVLAIVECVLPHLPRLSPDDVQAFLKNYVAFNKDLRSIVAMLHTNLYFALDPRLPLVVQYLADTGSVDRDEMIAVVQTALEQSCCVHPLLLPALCDQVPVSYAATAKHYAVATLQSLKKTLLWQAKPTAEPMPDVDGVCAVIRRHYHVLQSPTMLQYWLVLVLTIPEWYTRPAYRTVVDAIVALATPTMLSALEAPFSLYYDALCLLPGARSFVPPPTASVWSVFSGATATDLHFSYLALLLEVRKEKELYKALGHVILKEPGKQKAKTIESLRAKGRLATELYVYGVETAHPGAYGQRDLEFASFSTLRLFRVAQIVLACPNNTPMLVLWWQLWFALYFASIGSTFFGHHVWDLEAKQLPRRSLQAKLRQLSAHFSAQVVSHPSPYASELARLYSAMDAWLENTDVGLWMGHKESLPPHYCIGHATQLLQLSHVLLHTSDTIETLSEALCDRVAPLLWVHLCLPTVTVASSSSSNASSAVASPVSVLPSLKPVVWPEPIPMKRFKYLRFSPSLPTTPGPLPLELAPGPFVDRAMQYTDVLSQLTALETDFVEKLAKLYVPKLVVVTTSVPCAGRKGKDPAPCKRPSVLRLEYTEWHLDDASADVLATCQLQATRLNVPSLRLLSAPIAVVGDRGNYLQLGALDVQICFQILLIDSVVALLTSDPAAWQAQGVAWFHALLHLDSKVVRRCPPFQEVLWRSIQALGVAFIGVDQEETSGLLRFMLQDPARVVLLSDCFFPNNTPTRFVEYFATVMYHTPDLSTDDRLQLLRRFDIAKWLQASPSVFDRDTLLSIVLAELVLGQPSAEVHRMHAKTLHTLCSLFLEEHVDKVLCALLGVYDQYYAPDLQAMRTYFECSSSVSTSKPLDVGLWQAVAHVPNELWADLPLETLQLLVERVTSHVLARRSAGHDRLLAQQDWKKHGDDNHSASADVYELSQWQAAHVLKPCLDLVVVWVRAQATAEMMWSITSKVFEAMLQVLYMPSAPEPVRALAPWPSTDDATPATVTSSLWSCLQSFLERDTMAMQIKLDCIWSLMCNVLWPHAPDSLVKAYVPLLGRVPWDQWALHEETLNTMKDCLTVSTASMVTAYAIKFQSPLRLHVLLVLRDMLSRSPWPSAYLDAQPGHVQSSFFVKYHLLLIHVAVHHRDHALPRSFASFLSHPRRLARPIKSAEVDAVANGCRALLLHPTLLCAPVDAVADAHARYVAALRLLLSLCGLDLAERQGDELKKASTLLHLLALLLHPTGPDWKLARDAVGHHNVYAAVVASLASAAAVVTYDVLSLLHVHRSNFEAVFKPEHLQSLYADVFRMANVPVVDGAFQQRLAVAHTWMGLGDALHTVCDELRPSEASAVPLLEGHVEVLAPMASVGAVVASMLLSLAALHELESVKAACAAVASVHVMASLCERSLVSYVTKGLSWQPIVVDGVKVPELSAVEFVASCLERYTFLPLVAYCLQQDAAVAKAPWQEKPPLELQLCARFVEYVERACSVDDHMPREAEPALLFLCTTLFCLVLRLESVAMAFKQDMLSRVSQSLWNLGEARHAGNGLDTLQRAIGFSFLHAFAKPKFSTSLHTSALALSLFVRVHSRKALRLDSNGPLEISKSTRQLQKVLESVGSEKKELVALLISFSTDPRHSLADHKPFCTLLFGELYPAAPWLLKSPLER